MVHSRLSSLFVKKELNKREIEKSLMNPNVRDALLEPERSRCCLFPVFFLDKLRVKRFYSCYNSTCLSSTCSSSSRTDLLNKSGDYTRRQRTPCSQSSWQRNHQQLKRKQKDTVTLSVMDTVRTRINSQSWRDVYFKWSRGSLTPVLTRTNGAKARYQVIIVLHSSP